jgi:hypothetical protein
MSDMTATLATPPKYSRWFQRVHDKLLEEEQDTKRRRIIVQPPPPTFVLSEQDLKVSALRVQAGLAHGYWLSPYCRKLPEETRTKKLVEFLDKHLLPFLRVDEEEPFSRGIKYFAIDYAFYVSSDLSCSAEFIRKMRCSPEKLFEKICS